MRVLKWTVIGLTGAFVLLLVVVATRPAQFHVERTRTMAAPAQAVFEQVNNHRKFVAWNPFMKVDPNVKSTFSGPDSGVGAVCAWEGNRDIGAGACTIVESRPGELVRCRMDWKRPMEGTATVDFTFKPVGDKTEVTWAMYGKNGFMGKAMSLVFDCERMVGPQFEQGLSNLETAAASSVEGTPPSATDALTQLRK